MDVKIFKNYLIEPVLNLVAPPLCILCGKPFIDNLLCESCLKKLEEYRIKKPYCRRCGTPLKGPKCPKCHGKKLYFDKNRGVFIYTGPVAKIVESFKYSGLRKLGKWMAKEMTKVIEDDFDFITWVPLHPARKKERGFSQTRYLAKELSAISGKTYMKVLKRKRNTKSQTKLKGNKRLLNVKNAFEVIDKEKVEGKRILIIDDVMTTGATLNECAKELKKNGALKVFSVVFAIAI